MRVLLTDHLAPAISASDRYAQTLGRGLQGAGHDVRMLVVAASRQPPQTLPQRVMICRPDDPTADLPFGLPSLSANVSAGFPWLEWPQAQLAAYREEFRRQLDAEVAQFDPQMIDVQQVWIDGQLALETGVPYVLTGLGTLGEVWPSEPGYHDLIEQAVENASRIVVAHERAAHQITAKFESVAERIVIVPQIGSGNGTAASPIMAEIYRDAFQQRFGRSP